VVTIPQVKKYLLIAAADVRKVLEDVGSEIDDSKLNTVIDNLKGKNLSEVISAGLPKVAKLSFGGSSAPAATTAAAPVKEAVEEKKEEEEEEVDIGGGGLFGDDEDF